MNNNNNFYSQGFGQMNQGYNTNNNTNNNNNNNMNMNMNMNMNYYHNNNSTNNNTNEHKYIGNPTIALTNSTTTGAVSGYITTATATGSTISSMNNFMSPPTITTDTFTNKTTTNTNNTTSSSSSTNNSSSTSSSSSSGGNAGNSTWTSNLTNNLNNLNNTLNNTKLSVPTQHQHHSHSGQTKNNGHSVAKQQSKKYGPQDFEVLKLLGKGTFGQVYQVKKKTSKKIYAMKVLSKSVIAKKNEIAHTIGERNILVRTASKSCPFIVGLKFSFQTVTDLYLVTDFMNGGELFWHLQKEGRFPEHRAKFYIAELVLALEYLHDIDIVYRDLKPENILLDSNGHIALCDFGLSKADLKDRTNTFCGTTEYLAPELLLDETGYTKMVDFWSLGVLIFEMCCGWSPFFAEDNQKMYQKIAFGKVKFPRDVLSPEGRSFVKGLLNRNPRHRLGALDDGRELRAHPFLNDVNWELLRQKKIDPPFKPVLQNELDTSNFDPQFTSHQINHSLFAEQPTHTSTTSGGSAHPTINNQNTLHNGTSTGTSHSGNPQINKASHRQNTPLSSTLQMQFQGFTYVDQSAFEHMAPSSSVSNSYSMSVNKRKFLQNSYFMEPGSFIPGDPTLPPDENVIDDLDEFNKNGNNYQSANMHDQNDGLLQGKGNDMDDDDEHMGFQFD